jgi:hypothetical protein
MRKQSTVCVKDVSVPTDCIGSRNTSFRGIYLKITMNIKSIVVPDAQAESTMERQAMFPLKSLMR